MFLGQWWLPLPQVGFAMPLRVKEPLAEEALSRVDDPAGPGLNAHFGTAVGKGPRGGVEVSCFLVGFHFSLPLFCLLMLNKCSVLTNTMSSIFTKKEAAARCHFRATASCHVKLLQRRASVGDRAPSSRRELGLFELHIGS